MEQGYTIPTMNGSMTTFFVVYMLHGFIQKTEKKILIFNEKLKKSEVVAFFCVYLDKETTMVEDWCE